MNKIDADNSTNEMTNNEPKKNKGCIHAAWISWIKFCRVINDFIELLFEKHTRFITSHHSAVIIGSFVFVAIMAVGGVWFNALQRNEELFIPQGSEAFTDLDKAQKYFNVKFRAEEFILSRADQGNILNDAAVFKKALELHDKITQLKDFDKSCLKHENGGVKDCLFVSVLQVFNYKQSNIINITSNLNRWLQNPNLLFHNGRPASLNYLNILGNYKSSPDKQRVESADAIRMTYFMTYADTKDSIYETINDFEDRYISLCGDTEKEYKKLSLTLNYFAARTRDDAILASTVGDLPLFSVAFILMVAFCLLVFLRWKNPVTGHLTVAICGICVIMLGVGCGFGLAMWIRTDFVAFTGILMFLILGIGMDNMFIIVDALESVDPSVPGEERLVIAMKHIGGSITMTTTTDLVAFAVSTVSDFPAVHLFCVYAALSIFFAYAMLITLFLGLLTWDIHRIERGQRDICPCRRRLEENERTENPWVKTTEDFSKKILRRWGEILMTIPMKVAVFLMACGLLAAGIYGSMNITQKFEWKKLSRDGSYFRKFAEVRDAKFPAGYDVSIILPQGIDYTLNVTQQKIIDLDSIAQENSRYENMTLNWMKAYKEWANKNNISILSNNFYTNLTDFLNATKMFMADVNYDVNSNRVMSSRVVFFYEDDNDAINQAEAMKTIRKDLQQKVDLPGIFPISIMFIYAEQFAAVLDDTIRNLAICAGTVLIITLPYLMHPGITGLVFLSFSSLLFELLGLMTAWDVSLDVIAMIIIIMAIGFSVDYTCHIAHAYMISTKDSPEARVVDALSTMGTSVLNGGVSTFLGMLITAFSGAEGFRIFFKMVFGIVALGLIHGLVFLPVLLSLFVRRDLREDMAAFIKKHDEKEQRRSKKRMSKISASGKYTNQQPLEMYSSRDQNSNHSNQLQQNGSNDNLGSGNPGYQKENAGDSSVFYSVDSNNGNGEVMR